MFFPEKPRIVEGPKDVLVHENVDVYFQCRAIGDPEPTIIWKKVDEQMPQGRLVEVSIQSFCFFHSLTLMLGFFLARRRHTASKSVFTVDSLFGLLVLCM